MFFSFQNIMTSNENIFLKRKTIKNLNKIKPGVVVVSFVVVAVEVGVGVVVVTTVVVAAVVVVDGSAVVSATSEDGGEVAELIEANA
jgi:hypothetical protein